MIKIAVFWTDMSSDDKPRRFHMLFIPRVSAVPLPFEGSSACLVGDVFLRGLSRVALLAQSLWWLSLFGRRGEDKRMSRIAIQTGLGGGGAANKDRAR